jgi:hypothetical protein
VAKELVVGDMLEGQLGCLLWTFEERWMALSMKPEDLAEAVVQRLGKTLLNLA